MKKSINPVKCSLFLLLLSAILSIFSCKSENQGKGGLDSGSSPIKYTELKSDNELSSENQNPELEYFSYRLRKGECISELAVRYDITSDTLISVNNIKSTRGMWAGDYIKIPTIPGILYSVREDGETIEKIAAEYKISAEKCANVNKLEQNISLDAGTSLFLPDAKLDWVTIQEINGDLFSRPIHYNSKGKKVYVVSSRYGWRNNPFSGKRTFHGGIDMACGTGTPIYAALNGRVTKVGEDAVYGKFVQVSHHSGYKTLYAHMSKITCEKGQYVTTNSKLGEVGSTGMSTGPHLHFAIYKNGISQNPSNLVASF